MNDLDYVEALLYEGDRMEKIHAIENNEVENESNESFNESEWCPENNITNLQERWVNSLTLELAGVAALDPRPAGTRCPPERPK